jgi:hypothetical protein
VRLGVQVHIGAHRQDRLDPVILLEPSHLGPVDKTAIQDEDLDHLAAHRTDHLID